MATNLSPFICNLIHSHFKMLTMGSKKILTAALLGAAAGAVLGILLAPDKGSETRKKISKKAGEFGDAAKEKFNELGGRVAEKFENIRSEANEILEKGKDRMKEETKRFV